MNVGDKVQWIGTAWGKVTPESVGVVVMLDGDNFAIDWGSGHITWHGDYDAAVNLRKLEVTL